MKTITTLEDALLARVQPKAGMKLAVVGEGVDRFVPLLASRAEEVKVVKFESASQTGLPDCCCHYVVSGSHAEAALREAARILREDGRLIVVGSPATELRRAVHEVEHRGWTIHHSAEIDHDHFLLELTLTDESVQS